MATILPLYLIVVDDRLRVRKREDPLAIFDYTQQYANGANLGELECFYDGSHYWLTGGFLRIKAARRAGLTELPFNVRQGSFSDALLNVLTQQNINNGARLSKRDRKEKIQIALSDPTLKQLNNDSLAKLIRVTPKEINYVRKLAEAEEAAQEFALESIQLPSSIKGYPEYLQVTSNVAIAKSKPTNWDPDLVINFAYSIDDCFVGLSNKPTIDLIFDSSQLIEFIQKRSKQDSYTRIFWYKYSAITLLISNLEVSEELEDAKIQRLDDLVLLIVENLTTWKDKILLNKPEISLINLPNNRDYLGVTTNTRYFEMMLQQVNLLQQI